MEALTALRVSVPPSFPLRPLRRSSALSREVLSVLLALWKEECVARTEKADVEFDTNGKRLQEYFECSDQGLSPVTLHTATLIGNEDDLWL